MSKKVFNPKLYQNKARVYSKIDRGISKCLTWDSKFNEYRFTYYEARKKGLLKKEEKKTFQDLKSAKEWLYNINVKSPNIDQSPLFFEVLNDWKVNFLETLRKSTKNYYSSREPRLKFLFDIQIESLNPSKIDEWIAILKASPNKDSRSSFKKELKFATVIFNYYKQNTNHNFNSPIQPNFISLS